MCFLQTDRACLKEDISVLAADKDRLVGKYLCGIQQFFHIPCIQIENDHTVVVHHLVYGN